MSADIGWGVLPEGARLKARDLAPHHGTSTDPVREAPRRLRGEGVVRIERNRGATVAEIEATAPRDILGVLPPGPAMDAPRECRYPTKPNAAARSPR